MYIVGCSQAKTHYLEDSVWSTQVLCEGGRYDVGVVLDRDVDGYEFSKEVKRYLKGEPGAPKTNWENGLTKGQLSARDLWAYIYAQITNREFLLYFSDSRESRDAKINTLIESN